MTTLKLTAIGTSTGVIIPKEMLARMNSARATCSMWWRPRTAAIG